MLTKGVTHACVRPGQGPPRSENRAPHREAQGARSPLRGPALSSRQRHNLFLPRSCAPPAAWWQSLGGSKQKNNQPWMEHGIGNDPSPSSKRPGPTSPWHVSRSRADEHAGTLRIARKKTHMRRAKKGAADGEKSPAKPSKPVRPVHPNPTPGALLACGWCLGFRHGEGVRPPMLRPCIKVTMLRCSYIYVSYQRSKSDECRGNGRDRDP